jgi:hypothetical protein
MNIIAIFAVAFLLDLYIIWLVIEDCDQRIKNATSYDLEKDRYFYLMIEGLGMSYHDAKEEYDKIETFSHLLRINSEMKRFIIKEPQYV